MANTRYAVSPLLGLDFDARDTNPVYPIGTQVRLGGTADQELAVYVQANGAIAASQTDIAVTSAGQASDGLGSYENSAVAFADNEYGWVWVTDNV